MNDKELARFVEAVATALLLEVVNRGETMMEAQTKVHVKSGKIVVCEICFEVLEVIEPKDGENNEQA